MPRTSKGSARLRRGRWTARVTLGPGRRTELALPTCRPEDAEKAQERAELLSELADQLREAGHLELAPRLLERAAARDGAELDDILEAVGRLCAGTAAPAPSTLLTFEDLGKAWTSGELADRWPDHVRRKRTAHRDRALLEQRVYPLIGDVLLADWTLTRRPSELDILVERPGVPGPVAIVRVAPPFDEAMWAAAERFAERIAAGEAGLPGNDEVARLTRERAAMRGYFAALLIRLTRAEVERDEARAERDAAVAVALDATSGPRATHEDFMVTLGSEGYVHHERNVKLRAKHEEEGRPQLHLDVLP